jgi:LysM repeat protein
MNNPNPLVPQGSLLEQQKSKGKSNLFIAVFTILALHVVLFGGMLIQGCKKNEKETKTPTNEVANPFPQLPDTNFFASLPAADSNRPPVTPATNLAPVPAPIVPASIPSTPIPAPEIAGSAKEYKIAKGDTLAKIAKDHKVTLKALMEANPGVDSKKLKVGQPIQIPAAAATPATSITPGTMEPVIAEGAGQTSYTVKANDNLTRIAKRTGTTVAALKAANGLKTDQLHVGQKLKLPAAKAAAKGAANATETPAAPPAVPAPIPAPGGGGRL